MNMKIKQPDCFVLIALLVLIIQPTIVQSAENNENPTVVQFGGPNSVPGQMADDRRLEDALTDVTLPQGYTEWKENLRKENALDFTVDYNATTITASNTINDEDFFAGGVIRLFGQWDLVGRDTANKGSFIFKIENRHGYTDIAPNGAKDEIGYVGLISPTFNDTGTRLTNLYWKQHLNEGNIEITAGFIDVTDQVDVYALASPWTGFTNFVFATGSATLVPPDDATLGAYFSAMLSEKVYVMAGFADSNSDSTDPFNGFDTFFNDHEFFTSVELGLVTSRDRFYLDNTHITLWHSDEREAANVPSGSGVSFSYAHSYNEKWMPFLRGGYADDGGTLLQKSLSTGLGYHWGKNNSLFGLGLNWGQPNEDTFGPGLDDQYVVELFSRLQIMKNFQLTPDIQYIKNPALNPTADDSWMFALRGRIIF